MYRWVIFLAIATIIGCGKSAPQPIAPLRSGQTSLYGAPLPVGATLAQQTTDPDTGEPGMYYEVSGSMSDIVKFYDQTMIADGWQNVPPDTKSSRLFSKGGKKLLLIVNNLGGSFMLMGQ